MRVGLLLKRNKPEALELARELAIWLQGRGIETWAAIPEEPGFAGHCVSEAVLAEAVELLVVLGGDGTLLHAAALVADRGVPLLGINLGHLGFLTSSPPNDAKDTLARALDGTLPWEARLRLRVEVVRGPGEHAGETIVRYACNDAVISQGALARLLEIEARLDQKRVTTYRADGLIVSTPTGSTAYNLAAGGPIVTPDLEAMVLTPICPHTLGNRPLVVPARSRVSLRLGEPARDVFLTVDGQWGTEVHHQDRIEIHAANRPLKLFRPAGTDYFAILQSKLHWGINAG